MEGKANNHSILRMVSGNNEKQRSIISLIAKRTYLIKESGECAIHDIQLPLVEDEAMYADNSGLVESEAELFPYKKYSDIVIKGTARNYDKTPTFVAEVAFGATIVPYMVIGNRKPYLSQTGEIKFSNIEKVETIPLRYDFSYGGTDTVAEKKIPPPSAEFLKVFSQEDFLEGNLYRYPRNPTGKGYLVEFTKESIEHLELPNLEDPTDLLSPENIVAGKKENWVNMPLPRATDWVNPEWFPRLSYFGIYRFGNYNPKLLKEVKRGWVEPNIAINKPFTEGFDIRCLNGASLGLQTQMLKPGTLFKLTNIHPKVQNFRLQLPPEYPEMWVDGRKGNLLPTKPFINSVVIEPDENRLSIVWRGTAAALRPYSDEELAKMPYKVEWKR